jgi:AmiR/NasT family two-component response regulator
VHNSTVYTCKIVRPWQDKDEKGRGEVGDKARILVADDESVVRMDIKEMLLAEGYQVIAEAANGEIAIEQALRHRPDLILMDVKMPKRDGLEASRVIYQRARIPILLLTAYSQSQLVDEAKAAGVMGYLVKPVTESDLVPGIEMVLAQARRFQQLNAEIDRLEKKLEARKVIERAKGIIMQLEGISEAEAYRKLQTYCMSRRLKLEDVARRVLSANGWPDVDVR